MDTDNPVQPLRRLMRERREALGLTQQNIADSLGTQPEFIGMVEGGKRRLHLNRLAALADALLLDPGDVCRLGLYEWAPEVYRVLFGDGPPQVIQGEIPLMSRN